MAGQPKQATGQRSFAVINIRTPSTPGMASPTAMRLNKKSSSTLIPPISPASSAAMAGEAKEKAASVASAPVNMYKHTLRVQHASRDAYELSAASSTHSTGSGWGSGSVDKTAPAISINSRLANSTSDDFGSPSSALQARHAASWDQASGRAQGGISLNVHSAGEGQWKKITFPPGVTVEQARDLCMLRFNVWQRILERDMQQMSLSSSESVTTMSTRSSGGGAQHMALYWLSGAQWLDGSMLLSSYALNTGDALLLQDRDQPLSDVLSDQGAAAYERLLTATAEGHMCYLQSKGITTSWRKCWVVLRAQTLFAYPSNRAGTAAASSRPLVVVDLSAGFRLVDQHGQANRKVATSDQLAQADGEVLRMAMAQRQRMGDGAPLIVRCKGGVHVFCTLTAVDYDYWRRVLRAAQGPASLHSGSSAQRPEPSAEPHFETSPELQPKPEPQAERPAMSSLVHRPRSPRAAHVVACPRRDRLVAVAFRHTSASGSPCTCVLTSGTLHVQSEQKGEQPGAAECSVALPGATAISEASGRHVRLVDSRGLELVWLDVGDRGAEWREALEGVGVRFEEDASVALRKSRSFASSLARIDWPLPPTTLPPMPAAMTGGEREAVEEVRAGNPSLDAVGMRFAGERGRASRFAWFRRGSSVALGGKAGRNQPG